MLDREKSCCFTGHRPEKLPWRYDEEAPGCISLKEQMDKTLRKAYNDGFTHFICGMAAGCDMYFCEAALKLREEKPDITVEAAIPCEGQHSAWPPELRNRYHRLVEDCDFLTLVQHEYSPDCFMRRNRYMVDNSRLLIAAYTGRSGGTMKTILYAIRQGLEIIELDVE